MVAPGHRRGPLGAAVEQLADRDPARLGVDERPEPVEELDEVGLVAVVDVDLAGPRGRAGLLRVRGQVGVLEERVEDVEAEAVDAPVEPAPDHRPLGGLDGRLAPVQVGLLGQERVLVELAPPRLPRPARAAEERDPVVRRQRRPVGGEPGRVPPQVPVGVGVVARLATRLEPRAAVARVVHHEIEDQAHPAAVGLGDEPVEVGVGPEHGVDAGVVGDVVADVEPRRGVDRREPDRVDADGLAEVVETVDDARQVAHPVAVAVLEAARVDLVDDRVEPPVVGALVGRVVVLIAGLGHAWWAPSGYGR